MTFQFELLVLFDVEDPQWALTEDHVADCKEIFTLFDTDNVCVLNIAPLLQLSAVKLKEMFSLLDTDEFPCMELIVLNPRPINSNS